MNILFITQDMDPFRPSTGAMQRTSLLLQACAKLGNVDLLAFGGFTDVRNDLGINVILKEDNKCTKKINRAQKLVQLLRAFNPSKCYPINSYIADIVNQQVLTKNYDYIVVRYMPNAVQYGLYKYVHKLIIDIDDSPVDRAKMDGMQAKSLRNKLYFQLYAFALKHSLRKFLQNSKHAFFSNASQVINKYSSFLPNIPYYETKTCDNKKQIKGRILFVGFLGYPPNLLGVDHFIDKVYPHIIRQNPDTTFHIAGTIWDQYYIDKWEKNKGVSVLGFVSDIQHEYEETQLVVIPIYSGAGTCIKVLESMQMGRLCITTPIGSRGYEKIFESGKDFIVAEYDESFVKEVNDMINSDLNKQKIIESAQSKLNQYYTREVFFNTVKKALI